MEIKVNGDIEKALKLFKRQVQKEGVLKDLKEKSHYEKPSVKLKRKRRQAQKRRLKSFRAGSRRD